MIKCEKGVCRLSKDFFDIQVEYIAITRAVREMLTEEVDKKFANETMTLLFEMSSWSDEKAAEEEKKMREKVFGSLIEKIFGGKK